MKDMHILLNNNKYITTFDFADGNIVSLARGKFNSIEKSNTQSTD